MIDKKLTKSELKLFNQIEQDLTDIGFSSSTKGYTYLCHAIFIGTTEQNLRYHVSKKILPKVANLFNTKLINVEKACRGAIDGTYLKGGFQHINSVVDFNYLKPYEKPTMLNFISTFIERSYIYFCELKNEIVKLTAVLTMHLPACHFFSKNMCEEELVLNA